MPTSKVRITKTLLDAWLWSFKRDDGWGDFLSTLNRERKPPTKAMLDGTRFENVLNAVCNGEQISKDHEWYAPIMEMYTYLGGAAQQVTLFRETEVEGQTFLLHGVLDFLERGRIWDCKFSKTYHLNKYLWTNTAQTSMYLALVPEASSFTYIISDGKWVYKERYPRDIVPPVENYIKNFMKFLKQHGLWEVYAEKWSVQE